MDKQLLRLVFNQLQNDVPEIDGMSVVTSDGKVIEAQWSNNIEIDKVGAVGSALLGLGKKAIEILSRGELLQVVLHSTEGMLSVYSAGERSVLIVHMSNAGNLGMLNLYARKAASTIAEQMRNEEL
ncbi:MAG: roadblock/LC7 domain-containing protein [Bacteriovoracaceae bacterium]|nr:roadblock/LC7 domain-containing protein [Bacteroidota bacterium]